MRGLPAKIARRYLPISEIGESGRCIVYRVHDTELQRRVALKILREPNAAGAADLEKEYGYLRDLKGHHHIVEVHELGRDQDGRTFLTMELLEGVDFLTFARGMSKEPSWPELCARLVVQILGAVGYSHGKGILHLDLSSTNVMVQIDPPAPPRIKVLDFGSATREKVADGNPFTAEFMAPELLRRDLYLGPGEEVDHRADLYSIGVLAYAALPEGVFPSGRRDPRTLADIRADLGRSAPTLRFADHVASGFASIISSLLERDRNRRPGDCMAVIEALSEVYPTVDTAGVVQAGKTGHFLYHDPGGCMEELLAILGDGRSAIVEIRGGRRTGKSRFVAELAARFQLDRRGHEVIESQYSESGDQALAPLDRIPKRIHALYEGREAELGESYPSLFGQGGAVETDDPGQHLEDQLAALLTMALRERSLVITVDNATWADSSLGVLLAACSRTLRGASNGHFLLLVVAVAEDAPGPILELLRRYREESGSPKPVVLDPFTRADLRTFLERNWDWPDAAMLEAVLDTVASTTAGVPGAVEDVMRQLVAEQARGTPPRTLAISPESLARLRGAPLEPDSAFLGKLRGLRPEERSVLDVIAVAVRHLTTRDLIALCPPLDAAAVEATLEGLVEKNLIRRSVENFQWWIEESPRQLVYAQIDVGTRRLLHKRVGLYLEEKFRDNLPDKYDLLAFHFARSSDLATGRRYAELAAARFMERGQAHRAIPRLLDAIELHKQQLEEAGADLRATKEKLVALHLMLARALLSTLRPGESKEPELHVETAKAIATDLGDDLLLSRCLTMWAELEVLGWFHLQTDTPEVRRRVRLLLEDHLKKIGKRDDASAPIERVDLLILIGKVHRRERNLDAAEDTFRQALELARGAGLPHTNRILSQLSWVATHKEQAEGKQLAQEAVEAARRENDRVGLVEGHRVLGLALHLLEAKLPAGDEEYTRAAALAEELHLTPQLRLIYHSHADLLCLMCASERAVELARKVLAFGGQGSVTAKNHSVAGKALFQLSRYGEADRHLVECIEGLRADSGATARIQTLEARAYRGRIRLDLGDEPAGRELLEQVIDDARRERGLLMIPAECFLALGWHEARKAWAARQKGEADLVDYGRRIGSLCAARQGLLQGAAEYEEDQRATALAACGRALEGDVEAWRAADEAVERAASTDVNFRIVWAALWAGLTAYLNGQYRHAERMLERGADALRKMQLVEAEVHTSLLLALVNEKLKRDATAAFRWRKAGAKRLAELQRQLKAEYEQGTLSATDVRNYFTDPLRILLSGKGN